MYESYYGLAEPAFDLTPNPRFLLLTKGHREALSNLQYGISARKGMTLLTGEAGTGKTTLVRTALEGLDAGTSRAVHINNPTLSREEFVETLASKLGLSPAARRSKAVFLRELGERLMAEHDAGTSTTLIIDEAQSLSLELLEEVRLLTNIETNDGKLLTLVLAGQPELARRLQAPELRQLKQRIALRCELNPLSRDETAAYIDTRVRVAGGDSVTLFTRQAVVLIHERSGGIPRTINVLCDNALVGGFAAGERPVGRDRVLEVCRDFDFTGPEAKPAPTPGGVVPAPENLAPAAGAASAEVQPAMHGRRLFGDLFPRRGGPERP